MNWGTIALPEHCRQNFIGFSHCEVLLAYKRSRQTERSCYRNTSLLSISPCRLIIRGDGRLSLKSYGQAARFASAKS